MEKRSILLTFPFSGQMEAGRDLPVWRQAPKTVGLLFQTPYNRTVFEM